MLTFIERLESDCAVPLFTLALTAEERTRTRHRFETSDAQELFLRLPRGIILQNGDLLRSQNGEIIQIVAKAEPVLTVTAQHPLDLLKAAYHLGNRHVPLEIAPTYLRLSRDRVLQGMLEHLEVTIVEEIAPFQPEIGAYHSHER
jgi:urease accessory protein